MLVCILAATMLITMLAGCSSSGTNDTKKTAAAVKDKVKFAIYADLGIMDPNNSGSASDSMIVSNIYNELVFRTVKGEFIPI